MLDPHPRVAVLIAAYNAETTINQALASLQADPEPHDVILVDDGSRLPLATVVAPQPHVTILRSEKNCGQGAARNLGLDYILSRSYDYVAILDADDTAPPERLGLHRAFLDWHPDYGLVASWVRYVNEDGSTRYFLKLPTETDKIVKGMYYNNCVQFGMYRTEILRNTGTYRPFVAEDYDLVRRVLKHSKAANLPLYLYNYTLSPNGISQSRAAAQMRSLLGLQWLHRDFGVMHFYLGMLKTLLRLLLLPLRPEKKRKLPPAPEGKVPVFAWDPIKGQVLEGYEE